MDRRKFVKNNLLAAAALGAAGFPLEPRAQIGPLQRPGVSPETLLPEYFNQVALPESGSLLKVGFAERDITPAVGLQMAGDYVPTFVRGFHDACKVRAVVLDDGAKAVALVGVDTLVAPESVVKTAREKIAALCGIPSDSVMIGAAHNHSGGPVGIVQPNEYDDAPEFVRHLAYAESQVADAGYLERVAQQIADAVHQAYTTRIDACCGAASGFEDKVAFTRQFHMKNGHIFTHPGQGNPDIVSSAGATDPHVGVIGAWTRQGAFLGCVVNYTCHATTNPGSGLDASANWIFYMEKVIRGAMGANAVVVFLQGAAGNVTQVDNLSPYMYPQNTEWAEFVGGRVGAEVVKTLLTMVPGISGPVDARRTVLQIARRPPSLQHVREAYAIVKDGPNPKDRRKWIFAKETVLLDYKAKLRPLVPVELQAIQIGPVLLLANPAELFCQAGLDIKAGSRFPQTYIVSYANGAVGYVPTEDVLGPHGGGYESQLTSYSNLAITASAQIVETTLDLAATLRPTPSPTPTRHRPFTTSPANPGSLGPHAWSYGAVPAEVD
jgi:neutral ceramidase